MDQTLRMHVEFLKQQLQMFNQKLMENGLPIAERNRIESEIRAALLALEHYQKALALEESLRQ